MNPYINRKQLNKCCKNPKFCIVCLCTKRDIKVDIHHVCDECRRGTNGIPRRLPTITLDNGKTYFVDERLKQLRNVHNPHDFIDF
jgi:hypothetical protein